jgi:hypothetical protein
MVATVAWADPVIIDMTTVILDEKDKPIKDVIDKDPADTNCVKCLDLTVGHAIAHALFFVAADESGVTAEQKWSWAVLAERVRDDKAATLTAPQAALIEKRLGKLYGGLVMLRVMPMIEPNRKPPEIE